MLPGSLRFFLPVPVLAWACLFLSPPGIVAGDAGELAAAAYSLGPAHPPGYPLYVLLGRLFAFLPAGTPAFRMTFLSCLALAFSYPLLASASERVLGGKEGIFPAAMTALFVLTGPLVLAQVQGPEVYALFFLLSAYLLFLAAPGGRPSPFLPLSFAAGLAFTQHYLAILAVPALFLAFRGRMPKARGWAAGVSLLLLGLSPFLVLPLRAHLDPAANWGDPDNLARLVKHVIRSQYIGTGSWGLGDGFLHLTHYLAVFLKETWFIGLLAFFAVLKRAPAAWTAALAAQLLVLPFLLLVEPDPVNDAVIDAYFPPAILWSAPLLALGAARLLDAWGGGTRRLLAGILLAAVLVHAGWAFHRSDASTNLTVERMGRNVLLNLPRGGELYCRGDFPAFPLFYLKEVLGMRPDTRVRNLDNLVFTARRGPESPASSPGMTFFTEVGGIAGRTFEPFGVLFTDAERRHLFSEEGFWRRAVPPGASLRDDYFTRSEAGNHHLFKGWWRLREDDEPGARLEFKRLKDLAFQDRRLLSFLGVLYLKQGWKKVAQEVYGEVLRQWPRDTEAAFKLGILAEEEGHVGEAEAYYRRCIRHDPVRRDARNNLAVLLMGLDRKEEAAGLLEALLREDPKDAETAKNLALALWEKDPGRSKALLREYLRLDPGAPDRASVEKALK